MEHKTLLAGYTRQPDSENEKVFTEGHCIVCAQLLYYPTYAGGLLNQEWYDEHTLYCPDCKVYWHDMESHRQEWQQDIAEEWRQNTINELMAMVL